MATLDELLTRKTPPNNLGAERAVLGVILLQNDQIPKVIERLRPEDFYKEAHRQIYAGMLSMAESDQPLDLLTLIETLRRRGTLDDIGGPAALASIVDEATTSQQLAAYVEIVMEQSVLREAIRIGTAMVAQAYENKLAALDILADTERAVFDLTGRQVNTNVTVSLGDSVREAYVDAEARAEARADVSGLPSGFEDLDQLTFGWQPSDFVVLAARPSIGKTGLALDMAVAAAKAGKRVLIQSLEMSRTQLTQRMLCSEARVNLLSFRSGRLATQDWARLTTAAGRLVDLPIYIDDSPNLTLLELRTKVRKFRYEYGLDLLMLDYLQLLRAGGRQENRQQEVSEISRGLKALAKEMNIPVIALSALSRSIEKREKKEPILSDLRESGAIESDADVVLFIHRPSMFVREGEDQESELILGKQRNGPLGRVPVVFIPQWASFEPLSRRSDSDG